MKDTNVVEWKFQVQENKDNTLRKQTEITTVLKNSETHNKK